MSINDCESERPPEWLVKLESMKKKDHQLAHEIGCGSPCLKCLDLCAGLDLHFWRKICRNCKCKKEEHDVKEEGLDVHFNIIFGKKSSDKGKCMKMNLSLKNVENPQDTTEVLLDWVPPNTSNDVAKKYVASFPRNRMPISGTTGASHRLTQLKKQIPLHDLDPKYCHQFSEEEKKRLENYSLDARHNAVGQAEVVLTPIQSVVKSEILETKLPQFSKVISNVGKHTLNKERNVMGNVDLDAEKNHSVQNSASGNIISSGNYKNTAQWPEVQNNPLDNLVNKLSKTGLNNEENNSNWMGKGKIDITRNDNTETRDVPLPQNSKGNQPAYLDKNYEKDYVCIQCNKSIHAGDVAVIVNRNKKSLIWHPDCFVCTICQEFLVDLIYFIKDDKVYCGRDYATVLKIPRCFACDELIFAETYTLTEGKTYHYSHFCCLECDKSLADQSYIMKFDNPVCIPCYEAKYAKMCSTCRKKIAATESGIALNDLNWHASDSCFFCTFCKKSLLKCKFTLKNSKPFCSQNCVQEWNACIIETK